MSPAVVWRTLGGAACGALAGFWLMTILCDVIEGARNIWCLLNGAGIGVPIGAAVGSVMADRRLFRRLGERTNVFNKWGVVSIWVLVATLPAAVGAQLLSAHRSSPAVIGLLLLLLSASSSVVAARHGSRWWLVVGGIAVLLGLLVLLQMIVGE